MSLRIVFMGTPDFAVPCLDQLVKDGHDLAMVITQPDRPKGRGLSLAASPVKVRALELGLPVMQPESMRNQGAIDHLSKLGPDLIVTVAFGQLLPQTVLDIPVLGAINVHASLLPRLRGGAPIHWAIMNGDQETGVTTMHMARRLDAGDMILQKKVAIGPQDTVGVLHDRLAPLGAQLLSETAKLIEQGRAPRTAQDEALATYGPNVSAADQMLRWSWPVIRLCNRVRGLDPWPGAITRLRGAVLKIWAAEPTQGSGEPGTVLELRRGEGFVVATGDGAV
ncbi:MAG: methionyl-tRNA formyltransferase, partial [Bacillota bacterium]